jgi:ABC-2 type transport system permease protein
MAVFLALVRRELGVAFNSLTGYVVIAVVLLLSGFSLVDIVTKLNGGREAGPVVALFYRSAYFGLILLPLPAVITMRSFAAERSSGTYESLMTTPVGDWQVVLAKYTGAMMFYALAWIPLLAVLAVLRQVTHEEAFLELRATVGAYLGIGMIGSLFIAMGCFASALTRSQMVACMLSFLMTMGLWVIGLGPALSDNADAVANRFLTHVSVLRHMDDFAAGVIDSRHLVFHITGTLLFLFFTVRVVESRKWK